MMMSQETICGGGNGRQSASLQPATRPVGKLRRTRQPRNPQLSVARRNERERNRVKQVNNGFATLRDRLPLEYLQQQAAADGTDETGSDTPDLGSGSGGGANSSGGSKSAKTKKCSKVETLRSAIHYIKWLNELIVLSDLKLEPLQVAQSADLDNQQTYDDDVDGQLSVGEPLSCGTPFSSSTCSSQQQAAQLAGQQQQQPPQHFYGGQQRNQAEQFIKLEPQQQQPQHVQQHNRNMLPPSPATSLAEQTAASQQQCQAYLGQPLLGQEQSSDHTQLWIQRHQSSFVEQQHSDWQRQQQQQQHYFQVQCHQQQQQPPSPVSDQQQRHHHHLDWYANSPQSVSQQHAPVASPPQTANSAASLAQFGHQQHQISLYSQ